MRQEEGRVRYCNFRERERKREGHILYCKERKGVSLYNLRDRDRRMSTLCITSNMLKALIEERRDTESE